MNFVGHLVDYHVSNPGAEESAGLGTMWPDLVKLDGFGPDSPVRPGEQTAFDEGLEIHQRQDSEFHGSRRFLDTCSKANLVLTKVGLRRGPARAFSHVAYELRLDGLLLKESTVERLFRSAIGPQNPGLRDLDLDYIVDRLNQGYKSPESVAKIVVRLLSHRPRLAIDQPDLDLLADVVADMAGPQEQATRLLAKLEAG